ncbi:MAG: hypothetical protein U1A06_17850 [Hoeflea sp.]|nr:hypothetical protein [Hoeflea sp.]
MEAQEHRGADSTGFAIYGLPRDEGYVLRGMGFDKSAMSADLDDFKNILRDHGSDYLEDLHIVTSHEQHYCFRMEIQDPKDLVAWVRDADEISHRIEIQSCGRSLEIIKDTGGAREVADKHKVRDMIGTHGLGHARLATESSVLPNASHPFWARPFSDVAIVHNGQITDYYTQKERLERQGYRFLTENDSELIAVWVSDQIKAGLTVQQALTKSVSAIDGVFTFMIARPDGIGFAKDRFAMKPLVVIDQNGNLAAATEEQAVRRVFPDECDVINYDGPSLTGIWGIGNRSLAA